jgi:hypothetical protein
MQFKVGEKVKVIGNHYRQGFQGTVIRYCGSTKNCRIVKLEDSTIHHIYTQFLILVKNEQLLFDFMR